jgi:hypothetical protein
VPDDRCGLAKKRGVGARPGTLWLASHGRPTCREKATCVHDPRRCERLDGRQSSSSERGCEVSSRAIRGSRVDRIGERKKRFCRVTTRRRNLRVLNGLGRRPRLLAALPLCLGVPGFDLGMLAMLGLPPRCLPTTDFSSAVRILAIALVPTPGLVLATAAFAQALSQARSAPSGRTALFSLTLTGAHGRCFLPRESSGRMSHHSPRALSRRE